jgi:hypothetical protein
MSRFELSFLDDYSDSALLDEIRRVASQHVGVSLSTDAFDQASSRVSASTIKRRFGGWQSALEKAGVAHLYGGRTVSGKMRRQRVVHYGLVSYRLATLRLPPQKTHRGRTLMSRTRAPRRLDGIAGY